MRPLIAAAAGAFALGLVAVPAANAADMPYPPPYVEGEAAPPPAYAPPPQAYPPPPVAYAPPPPEAYYAYDDEDAAYYAAVPGPYYGYGYWRGYGPRYAYGYGPHFVHGYGHPGHWHYRH